MSWKIQSFVSLVAETKHAIVGGPFGSKLTTRDYVDEGVPVIRGTNMSNGRYILQNDFAFVSEEKKRNDLQSNLARPGDLLFTQRGTLGQVAIIPSNAFYREFVVSQSQMKATLDPEKADTAFYYYFFSSKKVIDSIHNMASSSGVPHINLGTLKDFEVPVPDLPTQKRIASILSAYDDLIENNRRRIVLLEQAARLLYREWFVHLRFPGHETIKIIDGLPEGWESIPASEAMQINPRTTWKATESKLITMVPMRALSTAGMICDTSLFENREQPTSVKFMNGDTLFARITPCLENGKTGYVNFLQDGEIACGSTEFVVFREHRISRFMAYLLAREEDFRKNAITSMVGSSGRQRVQQNCFEKYIVSAPPRKIVQDFDAAIEPMFQEIGHLQKVITKLTRARDLLLPRLMDGRIPV